MDDTQLVREFNRTGDQAHFTTLVERHQEPVFRLVCSILGLGREAEAEEVTQEVFLKVYSKLGQFRGEARFSTWLYRIAYNHSINHRRRLRFRLPHLNEEVLVMTPTTNREADPFRTAEDARRRETVEQSLEQLPDVYRSVLHLFYWMGLSVPEISEALTTPQGTIKSYLYRARAKLHGILETKGVSNV